jgi:hypothetical protein
VVVGVVAGGWGGWGGERRANEECVQDPCQDQRVNSAARFFRVPTLRLRCVAPAQLTASQRERSVKNGDGNYRTHITASNQLATPMSAD